MVLTKADLVPDAEALRADVAAAAPGVDVLAVSSTTGDGLDASGAHVAPGDAGAIGPSGAGKSTLVNALGRRGVMVTRELRADGKGRHTTVHRELVVLPGGGLVVDTPGSAQRRADGRQRVARPGFADVEELAPQCRFGDCAPRHRAGLRRAGGAGRGELPERRWQSYRQAAARGALDGDAPDARLRAEERSTVEAEHQGLPQPTRHDPPLTAFVRRSAQVPVWFQCRHRRGTSRSHPSTETDAVDRARCAAVADLDPSQRAPSTRGSARG